MWSLGLAPVSPVVTVCVLRTLHWPHNLPSSSLWVLWALCQDTNLALSQAMCKQIWENRILQVFAISVKTSWAEKDNRKRCPYDSFSQGLSSVHPALEDYDVNPHSLPCLPQMVLNIVEKLDYLIPEILTSAHSSQVIYRLCYLLCD